MVKIEEVKRLKSLTGVGITDAKKALEEAKGDFDKALEAMRVKGLAKADKRAEREAKAGMIHSYVHSGRIGVLVEVNCETDFVAKTNEFKDFVNDIALQVAASSPLYVSQEAIPKADLKQEKKLIAQELKNEGKSADMVDKITGGKLSKWYEEVVLLDQPFIKDPDTSVGEYTKELMAKVGENIVIRQMVRIELGGKI